MEDVAGMRDDAADMVAPGLAGLDEAQVEERVRLGQVNVDAGPKTKSVAQIVAEHTLTLFNGVNLVLALLVATTGSWRNLAFLLVVGANLVIGVAQEIRSKRIVDRLSILAARPVTVRRGGRDVSVPHERVVLGDLVVLGRGDQVPADAEVAWGTAGLNESLLTGESKPITKKPGDELMSGSFVDSGTVVARVTHVGADSYAARVNAEAKYVKSAQSEIMLTLQMIIRLATLLLAPIGILLFIRTLMDGSTPDQAILTTVAALVGMIPQGLVLLTSTVLVISTARLASRQVLVQQFYCIEMLARVDVLCLDKTGTITSGSMDFDRAVGVEGHGEGEVLRACAAVMRANAHDANETARAILAHADGAGVEEIPFERAVPFSSARKYSGCVLAPDAGGRGRGLVVGAAQFVLGRDGARSLGGAIADLGEEARVLVVAQCDGFDADDAIVGDVRPLGLVALSDHIRSTAPDTIRFFREQGVTLNVISGDDPATVAYIAHEAGVPGAEEYVDASTLDTPGSLAAAARRYHVFGRVTPQQKRELVRALQREGHTVAMTGDGVNDVLALREADCSVAMASGADAARNVAEVVLVDDDFTHMPDVVAEGRRSINNLQRSASLFLVKTVFSAVLAVLCALVPPYPFQPVQMSLISLAIIGLPSFVLALEPNHERVSGNFLANVLARSLPASAAIVLAAGGCSLAGSALDAEASQVSTACVILTCLVGLCLIFRISQPLNALRGTLLGVVIAIVAVGCTAGAVFFGFEAPAAPLSLVALALGIVAVVLFWALFDRGVRASLAEGPYLERIGALERRFGRQGARGSQTHTTNR